MRHRFWQLSALLLYTLFALSLPRFAAAQADLVLYDDNLESGIQSWSWSTTLNTANTTPVEAGSNSLSVTYTQGWAGLAFNNGSVPSTAYYTNLTFWINGGSTAGRTLNISANHSGGGSLPSSSLNKYLAGGKVLANTWVKATIPLTALGVANVTNFTGFTLQEGTGNPNNNPTYYLDDVRLTAVAPVSTVNINVNAAAIVRTADPRGLGFNTAVWDNIFSSSQTVTYMKQSGSKIFRFPGGSLSDVFNWQTNKSDGSTYLWPTNTAQFAAMVKAVGGQAIITVNYGSQTDQFAADWVTSANKTNKYGFKFWEIGNECYGTWENDLNTRPHDPVTYATRAKSYIAKMKAADPTIKIGVVLDGTEDDHANYTDETVTNPRTHTTHNGWDAVMLAKLSALGVTPDFVSCHRYDNGTSDQNLLLSATDWKTTASVIRQEMNDYLGSAAASIEILCTENNTSTSGKQTTSLVNGLYLADSYANLLQTEINCLVWWDLRNGQNNNGDNSPVYYGWRQYDDEGVISGSNTPYPTFYAAKLLHSFVTGGDKIVTAATDYPFLTAYATLRAGNVLALLVVNKNATSTFNANIAISGYTPGSVASVLSYGIPQDNAAQTGIGSPDIATDVQTGVSSAFSRTFAPYSLTLLLFNPVTSISGYIAFEGIDAGASAQNVTFVLRPTDGSASTTIAATVPAAGNFTLPNVTPKSYSLLIQGSKWLWKAVSADTTFGNINLGAVTLPAGDATGDNTVNFDDFLSLLNAFGSSVSNAGSGYDAQADFNCDGTVNFDDFLLMLNNFGAMGDL